MTDKSKKIANGIIMSLPAVAIAVLIVVIGVFLSAIFLIFDIVKDTDPTNACSTVVVEGMEIPVADHVAMDRIPSSRIFLDGITDWSAMDKESFFGGIRQSHTAGKDPVALKDLTVYDYETFMNDVFSLRKPKEEVQQIPLLNETYPLEVLIPVNEDMAFAVYRLRDREEDVYVYMELYYAQSEYVKDVPTKWMHSITCFYMTERLTFADVESLHVGDTMQELVELCPAIGYQLAREGILLRAYEVILEEGMLVVYIDDAALDGLREIGNDPDRLSEWTKTARISDMIFIPFGNILTEEEKAALIEADPHYETYMKYSEIPYLLLPE